MNTGTVINGTLKTSDLLAAFFQELERRDPDLAMKYYITEPERVLLEIALNSPYQEDWLETILYFEGKLGETCNRMLDELICDLNRVAPKGYYFGSHPGNSSDFGYWEIEDD